MCDNQSLKCNLCGMNTNSELLSINSISIIRCQKCGLVYVNPQPSGHKTLEIYEKEYFDGSNKANFLSESELYLSRFTDKLGQIERLAGIKGKLLDIGCAVGHFLIVAQRKGWQPSGVEISTFASEKAGEAGLDVFNGNLKEAKYASNSFDVVTMWHTLEHTRDPAATLKEVYRIMKNGGLLAIEVPNFNSRRSRHQGKDWEYLKPREHLYYFTGQTLKMMVEKAGFAVVVIKTLSSGTGAGNMLDKLGLFNFKKRLISIFRYLSWIKRILLRLKKGDDFILLYARKE